MVLRTETYTAQLKAFKDIISLTTRFLGLRDVFLRCEHVQATGVSKANIMKLWSGTGPSPGYEWDFSLELAVSCVCDEAKLAVFLEGKKLDELVRVPVESGEYSVVERLLVASESW